MAQDDMAFADILRCETLSVDGRTYRVQSTSIASTGPRSSATLPTNTHQVQDLDDEDYAGE